jgi:NAD(P)-dependent dehydrogenase (short-subunit alcohol dehydrogenase family)
MGGWCAAAIPDQRGRRIVVTGANSGIGLAAARELARAGASVTLASRDADRSERAAAAIRAEAPGADVTVAALDLADLASVRAFAETQQAPVDVLVNNAGVMATPPRWTVDGFELQLATNHLGHFALTGLLLDRLCAADGEARVVSVSSVAHRFGRIAFEDLQHQRSYHPWSAYAQSKLANLLFAYELQRRADAAHLPLLSLAAHPGYTATRLLTAGPALAGHNLQSRVMGAVSPLLGQSAAMGALPTLYAATVPELPGGSFVGPGGPLELRGPPRLVSSSSASKDPATARRLWEASEGLTGVRFALAGAAGDLQPLRNAD